MLIFFRLTVPENFLGEKIIVLERFGYRKPFLLKKAIILVSAELFCRLRVPKIFVGKLFNVSEKFGHGKYICIWEGCHYFLSKSFSSHSAEKFRGGTIHCVRKIRLSKKFMHKEEISLISVETPLSHSLEKFRRGTLLCFKKTLASKVFMRRRGAYSFVEKFFFASQDQKTA